MRFVSSVIKSCGEGTSVAPEEGQMASMTVCIMAPCQAPGGHMAEKLCPSLRVSLRSNVLRAAKEVGGQSGIASGHKGISSSGH